MRELLKKICYYIPTIVFNVSEIVIIFIIGYLLQIPINQITLIFLTFVFTRILLKQQLHYKDWRKCLLGTSLLFISFFIVAKSSIVISIIVTIFAGIIMTTKGNIDEKQLCDAKK